MIAKVAPADLSVLNPVLVPLVNMKIRSGVLDSIQLRAVGRADLAWGEMHAHYHGLRVALIKDGNANHSTILQKLFGVIANTFIVKNSNSKRVGLMYLKRSEDQSFINYVVQTSLSGVFSSIGLRKKRKFTKQYKNELRESGLPPVKL